MAIGRPGNGAESDCAAKNGEARGSQEALGVPPGATVPGVIGEMMGLRF